MHIPSGQTYVSPGEAYVEGDASSASYFLAGTGPCNMANALSVAMRSVPIIEIILKKY